MFFKLAECLCCSARALEGTSNDHELLTLFHMDKAVLQLEYLVTEAALDADLIDDVIQISVLLFWDELALALAALLTAL